MSVTDRDMLFYLSFSLSCDVYLWDVSRFDERIMRRDNLRVDREGFIIVCYF